MRNVPTNAELTRSLEIPIEENVDMLKQKTIGPKASHPSNSL